MAVYLLHATVPLERPNGQKVWHYVGYCRDGTVTKRVALHNSSKSHVPIVRAFRKRGAKLLLARLWVGGTRDDERRIKQAGQHREICPVCSPERATAGDVGAWRRSKTPK
jgi:hypothetical protein